MTTATQATTTLPSLAAPLLLGAPAVDYPDASASRSKPEPENHRFRE